MSEAEMIALWERMYGKLPSGKGESGSFQFSMPDYSRLQNSAELQTLDAYNKQVLPANDRYMQTFNDRAAALRNRNDRTLEANDALIGTGSNNIMARLQDRQDRSYGGAVYTPQAGMHSITEESLPEIFDPSKLQPVRTAKEEYGNIQMSGQSNTRYPPSSGSSTKPKYGDFIVKTETGESKPLADAGGDVFSYLGTVMKPSAYKSFNGLTSELYGSLFNTTKSNNMGYQTESMLQDIYKNGDPKDSNVAALRAIFKPIGGDPKKGTDWSINTSAADLTGLYVPAIDADGKPLMDSNNRPMKSRIVGVGNEDYNKVLSVIRNLTSDKLSSYFDTGVGRDVRARQIDDPSKIIDNMRRKEQMVQYIQSAVLMKLLGVVDAGPTRIYSK